MELEFAPIGPSTESTESLFNLNNNNLIGDPMDIILNNGGCDSFNLDDMFDHASLNSISPKTVKKTKKVKRIQIRIVDMMESESNALQNMTSNNIESSDEDIEDDTPYKMNDCNTVDQLNFVCNLCEYQAVKGWKQLTKHYVRKHPNSEIPISRLAADQDPVYLSQNPHLPEITNKSTGLMIKSHCPICNDRYHMNSDKWLMHFIAHTGNEDTFQLKLEFLMT